MSRNASYDLKNVITYLTLHPKDSGRSTRAPYDVHRQTWLKSKTNHQFNYSATYKNDIKHHDNATATITTSQIIKSFEENTAKNYKFTKETSFSKSDTYSFSDAPLKASSLFIVQLNLIIFRNPPFNYIQLDQIQ